MFTHVCESIPGNKRRKSSFSKYGRGYHESNSRDDSLFTCGGCQTKFRTICCLHVHIDRHQEGGSYTYDHVTKTAFPKFDSVCAYTQVEQTIFELITQNLHEFEKPSKSMQTFGGEVKADCIEVTRKSKRIAKRKHQKTQNFAKLDGMETKLKSAVSQIKNDVKNGKAHKLVSERLENENQKRKNTTVEYNTRFKKLKRQKREPENYLLNSDSESNTGQGKVNLSKPDGGKGNLEYINNTTDTRLNNLENINEKTDEITASEALIAISKSANGENAQNCSDSAKHKSSNKNAEISNVILDITSVSSENEGDKDCTNQSNVHDDEKDTDKQNTRQNADKQSGGVDDKQSAINISKTFISAGQVRKISQKATPYPKEDEETCEKQDKWSCPTCGKLGSRAMLSYHKYLHKEEKELSCDKCGKQFQHPTCLKVHLRSHEEKIYKCERCLAKFSRKKYLETHMFKHSGEKPYMCETCGKAYRDEMHLKRHIRHVHDQIRNFECDICKERFFRADHLKCHRMRHFEPGLRCEFCHKKFKVQIDLDRHLRLHTGEKKWFCHLCRHGFRYPVPYYNHMKKQHDIERAEAEVWRKKMIEEKKKSNSEDYMTEVAVASVSDVVHGGHLSHVTKNQPAAGGEVAVTMNISVKRNVDPYVSMFMKNYVQKEQICPGNEAAGRVATGNDVGKLFPVDVKSRVIKSFSDTARTDVEQASGLLQQTTKGYGIFRLADKSVGKSVKVMTNLVQGSLPLHQNLHFPLQDSFSGGESDGTRENGIVGYKDGSQLQDEQISVTGEETVVEDTHVISEIEGENTQAVMFIDNNECVGEVVIDQETVI
ncbi:zinc finger protein 675-like isoform X2 [Mercenaria mercenaria]|nr:zinc finger protein 675-like isoform X2 [Mercenaria mercenaria]XP_053408526.1 zinc finger protein 675-like isoform X2 [Mercenaria mercenaria]XP_053408527.1 zinc finger protein 675-like isoform X2 [Mercenaria mercenaria]